MAKMMDDGMRVVDGAVQKKEEENDIHNANRSCLIEYLCVLMCVRKKSYAYTHIPSLL